jgi:trehalose 6-phosphate synthase/phosphatase
VAPSPFERLLIVSNRLPVTARVEADGVHLTDATGGLATGLRSWHERSNGVWIGWPGDVAAETAAQREHLERQLTERRIQPVYLSADDARRYYDGFSNRVLWPLFHYLVDRIPVDATGWDAYRHANQMFADTVLSVYRPGDAIWVHDYQLMLVPALLRERLPDARIGFFLHIPFPSSEVFRILPWRREVLRGLVGADLLGFHTFAYLRHFVTSLLHIEGIEAQVDRIRVGDRIVHIGVFPMSIDAAAFEQLAMDPAVVAEAAAIRQEADHRRILLGVDRLDYTKGIPRRLLAFERLLEREPALRDSVRYIQLAVPSREGVDSYQSFRRQVEEAVGRINGTAATLRSTPIHYMHRSLARRQLVALYRAADVMLVTPLRDGMNLVAKEFIASRPDGDGVLILSEFAGAAAELGEAVVVNPYDVDAVAAAMKDALDMPPAVRRARMQNLRVRVREYDIHRWAARFIDELGTSGERRPAVVLSTARTLADLATQLAKEPRLLLLLDYDGTLVPIARSPDLAVPDAELLALLERLVGRPGTTVHLVSGRPRDVLDRWFGGLHAELWAEHGIYHRSSPAGTWEATAPIPAGWTSRVFPILEQFTANTPGSLIEKKGASVAWHYRIADIEFGERQAHELRMLLGDALSNQPLEVLEGKKVIEVRVRGVNKSVVAQRIATGQPETAGIVAIGDDRTDDDLFAALPPSAVCIGVGGTTSFATHQLPDWRGVRAFLQLLLASSDAC